MARKLNPDATAALTEHVKAFLAGKGVDLNDIHEDYEIKIRGGNSTILTVTLYADDLFAEPTRTTIRDASIATVKVTLFSPGGYWGSEEEWRIPERVPQDTEGELWRNPIGPLDVVYSPDFHTIDGGPILVHSQKLGKYPYLIMDAEK